MCEEEDDVDNFYIRRSVVYKYIHLHTLSTVSHGPEESFASFKA